MPRRGGHAAGAQMTMGFGKRFFEGRTGAHPAQLKARSTTPAGCTIRRNLELEEAEMRVT